MAASEELSAQQDRDNGGALMRQLVLIHLGEEGIASAQAGLRERAEGYLRRSLALDGGNADLWALLGTVVDGPARAACARQALALEPGHRGASAALLEACAADEGVPFRLPTACLRPEGRPRVVHVLGRRPVRSKARALVVTAVQPRVSLPRGQVLTAQLRVRLGAAVVLLLLLAADLALAGSFAWRYEGRIFPGVRLSMLNVGGMSPAQVERVVGQQVEPFLNRPLRLRFGGRTWSFTAAEVGLRYRVDEAVEQAFALGRRGGVLQRWGERLRLEIWGQEVPLLAEVQAGRLQAVLDRLAVDLDQAPMPPRAFWQETGWVIVPGQDGRHVVREEMERRLLSALASLVHQEDPTTFAPILVDIPVVVDVTALPEAEDRRLRGEIERAGRPLVLRCAEATWTVGAAEIVGWVRVELAPPPNRAAVRIDRDALRSYLESVAPEVEVPVQRPRLELNDEGQVVAFGVGQDGRRLHVDAAVGQLEQVFLRRLAGEDVESVELATEVIPAGNDALMAELGVVELVGEGTSTFLDSSPDRANNIFIGGREIHGRLIAPDEVFSLNEALDPITWEKGYRLSPVIVGGGNVVSGLGGGLCQVATTLYRAALYTGLEIVERHTHLWRVEYYEQDAPPGFDATIMLGGPDLKFRNNTGHYLLVQVETDLEESRQTVRFYGTSPGWQVTVDNLVTSNGGNTVSYVRTVSKDGKILSQETIYSYYY